MVPSRCAWRSSWPRAGVASRRGAEQIVRSGRVTRRRRAGTRSGPRRRPDGRGDARRSAGRRRAASASSTRSTSRPGVVSTARDPQRRPTVVSLIDSELRLYPVGTARHRRHRADPADQRRRPRPPAHAPELRGAQDLPGSRAASAGARRGAARLARGRRARRRPDRPGAGPPGLRRHDRAHDPRGPQAPGQAHVRARRAPGAGRSSGSRFGPLRARRPASGRLPEAQRAPKWPRSRPASGPAARRGGMSSSAVRRRPSRASAATGFDDDHVQDRELVARGGARRRESRGSRSCSASWTRIRLHAAPHQHSGTRGALIETTSSSVTRAGECAQPVQAVHVQRQRQQVAVVLDEDRALAHRRRPAWPQHPPDGAPVRALEAAVGGDADHGHDAGRAQRHRRCAAQPGQRGGRRGRRRRRSPPAATAASTLRVIRSSIPPAISIRLSTKPETAIAPATSAPRRSNAVGAQREQDEGDQHAGLGDSLEHPRGRGLKADQELRHDLAPAGASAGSARSSSRCRSRSG